MRTYNAFRQNSVIANPSSTRRGLLGAIGLAHHHQQSRQRWFANASAMAFSTDRTNTVGFIGLGAMGHHMVQLSVALAHVKLPSD